MSQYLQADHFDPMTPAEALTKAADFINECKDEADTAEHNCGRRDFHFDDCSPEYRKVIDNVFTDYDTCYAHLRNKIDYFDTLLAQYRDEKDQPRWLFMTCGWC